MTPTIDLFNLLSLLGFPSVWQIVPAFHATGPGWQSLNSDVDCFLQVYDLNLSENKTVEIVGSADNHLQLQNCLNNLPVREPGSIRIYIEEGCRTFEAFKSHIEPIEAEALSTTKLYDCGCREGFSGLFSQWSALTEQKWWRVVTHELFTPNNQKQEVLNVVTGDANVLLAGLIQYKRSVFLMSSQDGQLTGRS
jgi:hypothetical protein